MVENHLFTLFRLVSQATCFFRARRTRNPMDGVKLTILPTSHAFQEAHNLRLLLPMDFLHIFISPHVCQQILQQLNYSNSDFTRRNPQSRTKSRLLIQTRTSFTTFVTESKVLTSPIFDNTLVKTSFPQ